MFVYAKKPIKAYPCSTLGKFLAFFLFCVTFSFGQDISVEIVDGDIGEDGANPGSFRFFDTGGFLAGSDITVNYTVTGTATPNVDYTALSGTATILMGTNEVVVDLSGIVDDDSFEGNETVIITLDNTAPVIPINLAANEITLTIVDNDAVGVNVSAISGNTTEGGGTATFTVTLDSEPTAAVTVALNSSDPSEGTVPTDVDVPVADWDTGVTVTVTGVDDNVVDGDVDYTIVTNNVTSADANYNAINGAAVADIAVTNEDNDAVGVNVSAISGNTTEGGGTATFTVTLDSEPTAAVTVALNSSDPSEGTVPTDVDVPVADWDTGVTVTVTGVDDNVVDGDVDYTIVTNNVTSADANYNAINGAAVADIAVTNEDNDAVGVNVSAISGNTTEGGGTATFTVTLDSEPTAAVTVALNSSDPSEGTVPTDVDVPVADWDTGVTVTVTGVDDNLVDGDVDYTIVTNNVTSADANYNAINGAAVADIAVTNEDNDAVGVNVSAISGNTTEGGGTATFTVTLDSEPTAAVTVALNSSDPSEGTVPTDVDVPVADWDTGVTVTVTGVDDNVVDGDVDYTIVTNNVTSADANYNAINGAAVADIAVTNEDNDAVGVNVSAISGNTTEGGGTATFTVTLDSEPTAAVTVALNSSDPSEGTVPTDVDVPVADWDTGVTVTVTGVDDNVVDGDVDYTIVTNNVTSADANYNAINGCRCGGGRIAVTNDGQ